MFGADITAVVEQGFLVRTRSDTDSYFNETRARAAFDSGAKIIHTDAIEETIEFRDKHLILIGLRNHLHMKRVWNYSVYFFKYRVVSPPSLETQGRFA